jgi:endogenous inhibitor of DNA gyrase (YacG/DUF329 family)
MCDERVKGLEDNESFPFCSSRCKELDLGHWCDEAYTIPVTPEMTERKLRADDSGDPEG